ncbi:hypothetical protein D3C76_1065230 [compost metagenome]
MFHQAPHLGVQRRDHGGVYLHGAGGLAFLFIAQRCPARHAFQLCLQGEVGGHQAGFALALQALVGDDFVALVVAASVLRQVRIRRLQRPVRCGVGGKGEERFVAGLALVDRVDQAVGVPGGGIEVVGQRDRLAVVAIGGAVVRLQVHVGLLEVRRAAFEQHVGLVEAAVVWLLGRLHAQVPFAGDVGAVAGVVQQFGEGRDIGTEHAFVAGAYLCAGR